MSKLRQSLASVMVLLGGELRRAAVGVHFRLAESGLDRCVWYLSDFVFHVC